MTTPTEGDRQECDNDPNATQTDCNTRCHRNMGQIVDCEAHAVNWRERALKAEAESDEAHDACDVYSTTIRVLSDKCDALRADIQRLHEALETALSLIRANRLILGDVVGPSVVAEVEKKITDAIRETP